MTNPLAHEPVLAAGIAAAITEAVAEYVSTSTVDPKVVLPILIAAIVRQFVTPNAHVPEVPSSPLNLPNVSVSTPPAQPPTSSTPGSPTA